MRKTENKGFSLVELLIAVSIMAIIVAPLLNSFVSSFRVNAKSRQVLRATTLAQNEMEIFEKESVEALSDSAQFSYDVEEPVDAEDNGCYVFSRRGIINDDSGRDMFDVYVTLDPQRAGNTDRYYDQNNASLLAMNTISALDSGTYVQTIRTENNAVDQDTIAYTYFNTNKLPEAPEAWNLNHFKTHLSRTITVNIIQYEEEGKTFTSAGVAYDYRCNALGVMPAGMEEYSVDSMIYNNSQSLDEDGNPIELKSIYLFYAPRYEASAAGNQDTIIVNNEMGLPVDIYIIRQDLLVEGGSAVQTTPAGYQASLSIRDVVGAEGKTGGIYHTNLNINQLTAVGLGLPVSIDFTDKGAAISPILTRDDIIEATGLKALDASEQKDRIYEMTVKVYEAGADTTADTPLVTLTGTKIE